MQLAEEGETREDDHSVEDHDDHVGQSGQRIVPSDLGRVAPEEEVILRGVQHVLAPVLREKGEESAPVSVGVARKGPVGTQQHATHKEKSRREMHKAHRAHKEVRIRLAGRDEEVRVANEIAGETQQHDAEDIDPVNQAYRDLPNVDASAHDGLAYFTTSIRVTSEP